jgi:hypothetical protein
METFARQFKRASLLGLILLASLLAIDSIAGAHAFHKAHLIPVDLSVAVVAALLACWLVPPRLRKPER